MSDLLTSIDETCGFLKIQDKALRSLLALGLPVRIINGRYYAHAAVIDDWLRWFLNPAVSGGSVEIKSPSKGNPIKPNPKTRKKNDWR
jgi:RecJ-like exonuclease